MSINNFTIKSILEKTVPYLAQKQIPNPKLEADLMLAAVLELPRVKLYSEWERPLDSSEIQRYRELLVKRVQGWPLAYLVGKKSFLSWDFFVNSAVLIPRPETENLVEIVYDRVKEKAGFNGADIGVGSGAIVISLAKLLPNSIWYGIDLSQDALDVAKRNAVHLEVAERITFIRGDLLEPLRANLRSLDLIVSNPPYVPKAQLKTVQAEVAKEPVLALDGGADGLEVYRRLIPQATQCLKPGGLLAVEHGYDQRKQLELIFREAGFLCESFADLAGLDRIIVGRLQE